MLPPVLPNVKMSPMLPRWKREHNKVMKNMCCPRKNLHKRIFPPHSRLKGVGQGQGQGQRSDEKSAVEKKQTHLYLTLPQQ